ncbi:unnamed protein product, partial [Adineta steineri]
MKTNTENQQEATGAEVEQKKEETSVPRGTQEKTRVVWFTALFPYFVLTILMVRG